MWPDGAGAGGGVEGSGRPAWYGAVRPGGDMAGRGRERRGAGVLTSGRRGRAAGSMEFGEVRRGRSGEVQAAARVKGTRQPPRSGDGAVADGAAWSWSTTSRWRGAASRSGRRRASAGDGVNRRRGRIEPPISIPIEGGGRGGIGGECLGLSPGGAGGRGWGSSDMGGSGAHLG